jgi:hypothetical protein
MFGHVVNVERVEQILGPDLATRMKIEDMLVMRAQITEALCVVKQQVSSVSPTWCGENRMLTCFTGSAEARSPALQAHLCPGFERPQPDQAFPEERASHFEGARRC